MLTQAEADALIAMRKNFVSPRTISLPPGVDETHDLLGEDNREHFLLDLWRGTIRLSKLKYQTRGRTAVVLVRLDLDGAPHTNPDGEKMGGTHLHLYRPGYEDKWAQPVDCSDFADPPDIQRTFREFCKYCHVDPVPLFQEEML